MNIWEKEIPLRVSFLIWKIWFQRVPIREVLFRNRIVAYSVKYWCCSDSEQETFDHLFVACPDSNYMWITFAGAAEIQDPFVKLKQTIYKMLCGRLIMVVN